MSLPFTMGGYYAGNKDKRSRCQNSAFYEPGP